MLRRSMWAVGVMATLGAVAAVPGSARVAVKKPVATADARAVAVRVIVPGAAGSTTAPATPVGGTVSAPSFSYPKSGSVIVTGASRATAATRIGQTARAVSASSATDVSIFDGEITAGSVSARASAATGQGRAGGAFAGTGVVNLQALGMRRSKGTLQLEDWGSLTIGAHNVDRAAPNGVKSFDGFVVAIDVKLTAAHDGLPAGSEIQVGYAETKAATAPPVVRQAPGVQAVVVPRGDRPQLWPPPTGPLVGVPQVVEPPLAAGPYLFPVFGRSSLAANYGSSDASSYTLGDDIFGELGQPLVAVADGTVFSVGWNKFGGNRLWLRDHDGNEFYYAHLSAFSTLVANGARVRAGQVIGFMGDTGNVAGKPTHLHFEVHPVSMLFLGPNGAVDPTAYLQSWRRLKNLTFPIATGWAPNVPGTIQAPEPGAVLIGASDLSSADGLNPSSLRRVLAPSGGRG